MNGPVFQWDEQRAEMIRELSELPAFRSGTINPAVYRKCGKRTCVCAREGHPGHGPMVTLTCKKEGKTRTRMIRAHQMEMVHKQMDAYRSFLDWQKRWMDLNERVADQELAECESTLKGLGKKKLRMPSPRKSDRKSSD